MGREGWIYGALFVLVLGAGAALIVPRLLRLREGGETPAPAAPSPAPAVAAQERVPVTLSVRGPRGPLRSPLKPVVGAATRLLGDATPRQPRLTVHAHAEEVAFGASGHQWVRVDADALVDGQTIVLPAAAPPLVVRVREADGRPAPDVPVETRPARPGGPRRTDAGGTVVIDDAAPGLVEVAVGGSERRGPLLRLRAGHDDGAVALLEPAWRIDGRVLDEAGAPVPGVRVLGLGWGGPSGRPAATDQAGRFRWEGPVESVLALRLEAPGRPPRHLEVRPPRQGALASDVGDVVLAGEPGTLHGRLLVASLPEDVQVTIEPAVAGILQDLYGPDAALHRPRTATLDETGAFAFDDLPVDLPLRLAVRGAGLPVDVELTVGAGAREELELAPPPGHVLEGRLADASSGDPLSGVVVRLAREQGAEATTLPGDRVTRTDGAGLFRLTGLAGGDHVLRVHPPAHVAHVVAVRLPRAAPLELALTPVDEAAPDRAVAGRVVDEAGRGLPGVLVRSAGRTERTDAEGRFRLLGVRDAEGRATGTAGYEPGPLPDGADPRGLVPGVRWTVAAGSTLGEVRLPRWAGLRMRLLDGVDERPLSAVHVVIATETGDVVVDRAVALGSDGACAFEGLVPRGLILTVLTPAHRLVRAVPLAPGEVADLGDVRVPRGLHVEGVVEDADGEGIAGARVGALESGWVQGRAADPAARRELLLRHTEADDAGRFVLEGLDPRRPAVLAAWGPGFAPAVQRVLVEAFQDDVHASTSIRLRRGGSLSVELVDAQTDEPIEGALLDLEDARTGADHLDLVRRSTFGGPVASDEDWRLASARLLMEVEPGRYLVGPVAPGPYEVWADRLGYEPVRRRLTILDPGDGVLDLVGGTSRGVTMLTQTWAMEPR